MATRPTWADTWPCSPHHTKASSIWWRPSTSGSAAITRYSLRPRRCRRASTPIANTTTPPARSPSAEKHMSGPRFSRKAGESSVRWTSPPCETVRTRTLRESQERCRRCSATDSGERLDLHGTVWLGHRWLPQLESIAFWIKRPREPAVRLAFHWLSHNAARIQSLDDCVDVVDNEVGHGRLPCWISDVRARLLKERNNQIATGRSLAEDRGRTVAHVNAKCFGVPSPE